jgi:hypothetical protein
MHDFARLSLPICFPRKAKDRDTEEVIGGNA